MTTRTVRRRSGAPRRALFPAAALLLLLAAGAPAQEESPFDVYGEAFRSRGAPESIEILFHVGVPPGLYLYGHMLAVDFPDTTLFRIDGIDVPPGKVKHDPFLEEDVEIFEHSFVVTGRITLGEGRALPDSIRALFSLQGCTSEFCYFPEERELRIPWAWREEGEGSGSPEAAGAAGGTVAGEPPPPRESASGFDVAGRLASKGLFLTYLAVFFAGILLSFTPCVFPMIPITLSVIGARGETSPAKGFALSLVYVLGMALTYAVLGLVAASTSMIFGSIMQNPVFVLSIAAIFLALALSMFGLYELEVPPGFAGRLNRVGGGGGWIGIFLMGIVAGLVASPCVGPVLVGLLVYIAKTGSALLGFTLLFTLAMGIGVLFLVIGTFSGMIGRLPGAGEWMDRVKTFFGFLLIGAALYFAGPLLPEKVVAPFWGALLLVGAAFFGFFESLPAGASAARRIGKAVSLVAGASGLVVLLGALVLPFLSLPVAPGREAPAKTIVWIEDHDLGLAQAKREGRPVIIDFTADWCAACRELEHLTYTNEEVIDESARFVMILVDCTRSTPEVKALLSAYDVQGLPTVVFLDAEGGRRTDLTVTGFVEPEAFVRRMRAAG